MQAERAHIRRIHTPEDRAIDVAVTAIECLRLAEFALDNRQHESAVRAEIARYREEIARQMRWLEKTL